MIVVISVICITLGVAIFQGDPNHFGPILLCDIISYYAPFIHLVFLFMLWILTLTVFDHDNINYTSIFNLDPDQNYLKAEDILVCAGWMILVIEAVLVVQLYLSSHVVPAAAWLPALSVSQVFLTDLWVSTTKVFSDLVCLAYRIIRQMGASSDMDIDHVCYGSPYQICRSGSVLVPIIQILPYILRCVQCFQLFWRTGTRINCLNGLKFFFAIPVIFLPFLRNHFPDGLFIWIFLCVFNSVWMIYWDLVEDWGFRFLTEGFSFNEPDLHICGKKMVMAIDILLRFSWTYKLIPTHYQENHPYRYSSIVFSVTALEIFRRFLWTLYRMKNESDGPDGDAAEPEDIGDVPVV
ncbi:hypothetical protein QYF36_009111 [Acer negundo]|nr:hypothetical protein QYF36_009111 [Acer negundo]